MAQLPPNHVLTHHMLVLANACREQRKLFVETFGYKVKINSDNLRKAHNQGLNIAWFGRHFCRDFDTFQNEYDKLPDAPADFRLRITMFIDLIMKSV